MASDLFDIETDFSEIPRGLHLIASLTGFTDAGSMVRSISEQIFENLNHQVVVQFKNDELLDYRSRRPVMYFEKDHIANYEPANLAIYLVSDEAGQQFLYLEGYEPDFRWEAFADGIQGIIAQLEISSFTWVHSIPFPIPHTRALGVTVSGNQTELISRISEWKPQTQVPGNVMHLLEYRLAKQQFPTVGFVILVPHYLSDVTFPQAAVSGLEQISAATGLVFPTDNLREEGALFVRDLAENMQTNSELAKLVANLERTFMNEGPDGLVKFERQVPAVPTAEEIASELEDYLSLKRKSDTDE